MYSNDTIVSPITPASGGSVCLIRISGSKAFPISKRLFSSRAISKANSGTFHFGKIINEKKEVVDEVILYLFRKPKSYTGEDVIEISCHNNIFIIEEIIDLYIKAGCRMAEPGEYTKRAFLNGKMDLTQAEAVADIIASKSKVSLKNSIHILEGSLSTRVNKLKHSLIDVASLLELEIDFSEEDLEVISAEKYLGIINECLLDIDDLIQSFSKGRQFQKGIEVLITGKPNVGKSSLMNALLGKNRVIVSQIPGTTRDLIHEDVIFEDVLVRLIDTAGIRLAEDEIEKEGVQRAKALVDSSEIILVILDISDNIDHEDKYIVEEFLKGQNQKVVLVGNKVDKNISKDTEQYLENLGLEKIYISAKDGLNINELKKKVYNRIQTRNTYEAEEVIISNKRQYAILKNVKRLLEENRQSFQAHVGFEFVAADLRITIDNLSEITGEITTDDILNNIFSSFCIGK